MFTRYAKVSCAIFVCLILPSPLIGFNVAASPLLQATPTGVSRTPTATITQVPRSILETLPYSGSIPTTLAERYYEVKAGDTLWAIAKNMYGNGALYTLIQQANDLPDKAILRVGSNLLIPSAELATPIPMPSPQATDYIKPLPTSVPQNTASLPTARMINSSAVSTPAVVGTLPTSPDTKNNEQEWSPVIRYIQLFTYLLSIVCFFSSFYYAYLSFETYQRHGPYIRRRHIGDRVRTGL